MIVNGAPIFDGVDPGGLQTLLDAALPNLEGGERHPTTPHPPRAATDEPDAPSDQPGMTGEGSYESPHHGFALTWTDEWTFDPAYDAPVASNVNLDFDEVHLTVDSPQWVWFGFYAGVPLPGPRLPTSWRECLPRAPRGGDRCVRRPGRCSPRRQ